MGNRSWTTEEDRYLASVYPGGDLDSIAEALGRGRSAINQRAAKLRLHRPHPNDWTPSEIKFLRANYRTISGRALAMKLGRSYDAVRMQAARSGLTATLKTDDRAPGVCPSCGGPRSHGAAVCMKCNDRRAERHPGWRGDSVDYSAVHYRLKAERGRPGEQPCSHCGQPAEEWAYDHSDPDEHVSERGRAYSLDPAHYIPLCKSCHRKFDSA